ncbi:MAG: hypothetical protein NVS3B13_40770 [Mucilaginibacter sp.]
MIVQKEAGVYLGIFILGDGDYGDLRHVALQLEQARELLDAWRAPGGPEVDDDDMSAETGKVDGAIAVGEGKCGRG